MNSKKKRIGLSGEYKQFNKFLKHLRKLHNDSFQTINNVILTENLSAEQVQSLSATPEEIEELQRRLHYPSAIVIAGQDNYGKVAVLTKLLGVELLPFYGTQHTCNNVPQFQSTKVIVSQSHEDSEEQCSIKLGNSCSTRVSESSVLLKESVPHGNALSAKKNQGCEKPWRGIKISFNATQVTYSVVRPSKKPPQCFCENISAQIPGKHKTLLADDMDVSSEASETNTSSNLSSSVCTNTTCSSNVKQSIGTIPEGSEINSDPNSISKPFALPSNVDDITVDQLNDLLDAKFKEKEEDECQAKGDPLVSAPKPIKIKDPVNIVPLSEIELESYHLSDPILRDAVLDVGLNHCLLKEQVQIIVTPTMKAYKPIKLEEVKKNKKSKVFSSTLLHQNSHENLLKASSNVRLNKEPLSVVYDIEDNLSDISSASEALCDSSEDDHGYEDAENLDKTSDDPDEFPQVSTPVPISQSKDASSCVFGTPLTPQISTSFLSIASENDVSDFVEDQNQSNTSCLLLNTTPTSHKTFNCFNTRDLNTFKRSKAIPIAKKHEKHGPVSSSAPSATNYFEGSGNTDSRQLRTSKSTSDLSGLEDGSNSSEFCEIKYFDTESEQGEPQTFLSSILPHNNCILFYAITKDELSEEDIKELKEIRDHTPSVPVAFVRVPPLHQCQSMNVRERREFLRSLGILPSTETIISHYQMTNSKLIKNNSKDHQKIVFKQQLCDPKRDGRAFATSPLPEKIEPGCYKNQKEQEILNNACEVEDSPLVSSSAQSSEVEIYNDSGLIFQMEKSPKKRAPDHEAQTPIKMKPLNPKPLGRTVFFSDEQQILHTGSKPSEIEVINIRPKKIKPPISLGNCATKYTIEEIERIKKETVNVYKADILELKGNIHITDKHSSNIVSLSHSDITDDIYKLPKNILFILRETLGFFRAVGSSKPYHKHHCHLFEQDMNDHMNYPFQTAFNNKNVGSGNNDINVTFKCQGNSSGLSNTSLREKSPNSCSLLCVKCELLETFGDFDRIKIWVKRLLESHVSLSSQLLSKVQSRCLSSFVVFAFEFSRRLQITPKRLAYAKEQEAKLYDELLSTALQKEEFIRDLISRTLSQEREAVLSVAENFQVTDVVDEAGLEICIQELVLKEINRRVGNQLVCGVQGLRENCIGTLQRCLTQLEEDCIEEQPSVTHALKKLVNAAYQVEVRPTSSWGLLRSMWERIKLLLGAGFGGAAGGTLIPSTAWQRQVASSMIDSLSSKRLARTIATQLCGEIKTAHSTFLSNLELLEYHLNNTLENTQLQQLQLKSVHAPKLAKLALHTDALYFRVNYGLPELGRELGRGHFGVVYGCKGWGGYTPCAVKTLLPRDAAQWRDISMQYYYTRLMGHHERIVGIHACLIDKHFGSEKGAHAGGPTNHCVMLIMDVHKWDLDAAIRNGLSRYQYIRIAIDVVQGMRFLHSQGLIHRDIKPKNILIDYNDRAKVTDLDFCKPEAMMTGSVVGTPIHMAPELFTGAYDSSVDVYAFGVLFWYLCSGKTNMPRNFCLQKSKEDLKMAVYKGVRPECLSSFTPDCWALMNECWAHDPQKRLLLGSVEERLSVMLQTCEKEDASSLATSYYNADTTFSNQSDEEDIFPSSDSDDKP